MPPAGHGGQQSPRLFRSSSAGGLSSDAAAAGASGGGAAAPTAGARAIAPRLRRSFNTARTPQPLDTACSASPLTSALQAQYSSGSLLDSLPLSPDEGGRGGELEGPGAAAAAVAARARRPLHERVALLAERYCEKLQDITGEFGESTALDIGCMTGALTFCMAASFRHVLGIEADEQMVLAAKELKAEGRLEFVARDGGGKEVQLVAEVPNDVDRDRVRFWHYPHLPALPPKLAPVDAVVLEDAHGRLDAGLGQLLEQLPAALLPRGVVVVSLPAPRARAGGGAAAAASAEAAEGGAVVGDWEGGWGDGAGGGGDGGGGGHDDDPADEVDAEAVKRRMAGQGLELVHEELLPLPRSSSSRGGAAGAGCGWPAAASAAVLLVWKKPGVVF